MKFGFSEVDARLNLKEFLFAISVVPVISLAIYFTKVILSLIIQEGQNYD